MDEIERAVNRQSNKIGRFCLSQAIRAIRNFMYLGCPAEERPGLNRAMLILNKIRTALQEDDEQ